MSAETAAQVIACLESGRFTTLDLTGGAPELNPNFRALVTAARRLGIRVMDRCNLTALDEPGQETLAEFLTGHRVEVIASLPCYLEENIDGQRGRGVFEASLEGLHRLNALGYGKPENGRILNLVYNPTGPFLPPPQPQLEAQYREQLRDRYGIVFNRLFTLTPAHSAFRQPPDLRRGLRGLYAAAAGGVRRPQPGAGDVPHAGERRLAGMALRLRLQPDAGPAPDRGG